MHPTSDNRSVLLTTKISGHATSMKQVNYGLWSDELQDGQDHEKGLSPVFYPVF